jgi:hypothetical protein
VFREQADWTLILTSAASCESAGRLAEENGAVRSEQLAHIVYFFRLLLIKYVINIVLTIIEYVQNVYPLLWDISESY